MKWRVLVSAPYILPVFDEYQALFKENDVEVVLHPVQERLSENELLPLVRDIDGVICGDDPFTERVLEAAPRLKVISKWGTGINSIDRSAAERRGIRVFNTPNAFSDPVADTVMGYILTFARGLYSLDQKVRSGKWEKRTYVSLKECVVGVVGVGNIGKAVIRRAFAFEARLLGNDILEIPTSFIEGVGLEAVSLDELLTRSDFVSLNCDLNSTSYHLIRERELERMKTTAYLINTSRGSVIDEKALIRALEGRRIAGAALDVFEEEPLGLESPLRTMSNVLLAPHNANASPRAWRKVHEDAVYNLIRGLRSLDRSASRA
jgi:D-3-phosphoglycerate dehydrogenase